MCRFFGVRDLIECPCGVEYCKDCLEKIFVIALTDESKFPPLCCRQHIHPHRHCNFVDDKLMKQLDLKEVELSTPNRLYCAKPGCGQWIHPDDIRDGHGVCRNVNLSYLADGRPERHKVCTALTCVLCRNLGHEGSDCPQDDELNKLAAREGWRKCNSCNRFIELDIGCYHMSKFHIPNRHLPPHLPPESREKKFIQG